MYFLCNSQVSKEHCIKGNSDLCMMSESETEFLRDQVSRLNAVLAVYQQKYPPESLPGSIDKDQRATWLTDQATMAPLFAEYDMNINSLKEQVKHYQTGQKDIRNQLESVLEENKRLRRELKECVQSQLEELDPESLVPGVGDEQVLSNLQTQLQAALHERDSAMEMWHASAAEVERLEAHLSTSHVNPRLVHLENELQQTKHQYSKTVTDLNKELNMLEDELSMKKNELQASNIQVSDLKHALEDTRAKMRQQESERFHVVGSKEKSENVASNLHKKLTELESEMVASERKVEVMKRERTELEDIIKDLKAQASDHEQKAYSAMLQVKDSVQMVEGAMLEKDQALQQTKQLEEEVARLNRSLNQVFEEAGARTREEVDSVRQQCNQNIARLMEEIHTLEMTNTDGQTQIERLVREKRAVESELNKLTKEGLAQGSKERISIDELTRRACDAETKRDEALLKLDSMEQQNKRLDMTYKRENSHLKTKVEQLTDRLTQINQDFDMASQEKVELLEKIDELKRKMVKARQEVEASGRNKTKEMAIMEQDLRRKEKDSEVKLQAVEDNYRRNMSELRSLLASQQRMSEKWKTECNSISQKYEVKLGDLRSDLTRQKQRCAELSKLLKDSTNKAAEAQHMMSQYTENLQRLEQRVRSTEQVT